MYSGLNLRINIGSGPLSMSDLSGGQKSIIALSLLFALNSLTPSMIYLLDEVDSALDRQHRESLTAVLEDLSKGNNKLQFFVTSFKPELVETVDKIFQVSFVNGQSKLSPINQDQARELIDQVEAEE